MTTCFYNDIEKKIFSVRAIKCWNRLSSKAVDAPFQSVFKRHLDIILIVVNLEVIRQLDLEGPFHWLILHYCTSLLWEKITFFHPRFTNLTIISLFHLFRKIAYICILKSWNLGIKKNGILIYWVPWKILLVFLVFYVQNHQGERHCNAAVIFVQLCRKHLHINTSIVLFFTGSFVHVL